VGFREFRLSGNSHDCDNEVSVFYPICKEEYARSIGRRNVKWLRHADKTLMGIARASGGHAYGAKGLDNHGPLWTLRSLARVKMDVVQEAELHKDYSSSTQKALIPLIYCHGLSSNRTMHSGTCRDLASHGYLVFVLDHQDGTSSYTVSKDGNKEFYYENRHKLYDSEVRKS